jgi:hypothetical protein
MDGIGDREGTGMEKRAVIRSYQSLEAKGLVHIIRTRCKGGSLPLTFELTLPIGERGKPTASGKIAMQTRMTPLEGERGVGSVGGRRRPTAGRGGWRSWSSNDSTFRAEGGILKLPG